MYKTLKLLIAVLSLLPLMSCSKEIVTTIEWSDVYLRIRLLDEEGNNYMDPDNSEYFIGEDISILFQGVDYHYDQETDSAFKSPHLSFSKYLLSDYYLTFGPLKGEQDFNEILIVLYKSKVLWEIQYICSNHNEVDLSCVREWYLNGEKTSNPIKLRINK